MGERVSKFKTIFSIVRGWKNALVLDFVGNDNIGWYKGCLWATPSPGVGERSTSIYDCPFEDDQKAKVAEFTARYRQLTRAPSAAKCLDECANGRTRTFRGTLYYMAPEIMCRKYYGKEVDWWTVGITTHALLYGKSPLQVMHSRYNEEKLRQTIGDGFSQDYFKDVSDAAKDFMYWTLRVDPMFRLGVQRPGQSPMKRHVFFVGIDFKALYLQRILFPRFPYMPVPLEFIEPSRDELRFQTPAININDDEYDCF
ncbi:protein kinase G11A-like isoform X2 [Varroa jacobsoni]|uniref:Protein kinase domain-containing protein n=1 Tax=Varroa destructor TaxID=109461 RepID=A0A7M7K9S9_VARDE|nr:protein kinase G11A-like isoform X3 [Varroa destructor]XP_022687241.1 protein kinase G11A-like isoform X2 [Varroa jacobsoni]